VFGEFKPHSKFRSFAKAEPNSQFRGIYIRSNLIRIWVSFICKLSGTLSGVYSLQIPILSALYPQLNLLNAPEKIPGYATDDSAPRRISALKSNEFRLRYIAVLTGLCQFLGSLE
jgi:hypothetical protein